MNELYERFPDFLKKALYDELISFPEGYKTQFDSFVAYRMITRKENESLKITDSDFIPHINRTDIRKSRLNRYNENDPSIYSISLFCSKDMLVTALNLPKPNKYIIKGSVNDEQGVCYIHGSHVDWWLYKDQSVVANFEVIKNDEY